MLNTSSGNAATRIAFAILATSFSAVSTAQGAAPGPALPTVSNVWVKTTVPGGSVSAAYMHIKSATALKLVKAESSFAGIVEIHDMKMNGGVMQMKALDSLDIPVGKTVELKPGGTHVMLMKVKEPIRKDDKVPLTLTFEGANKKLMTINLDVIARENDAQHHKH